MKNERLKALEQLEHAVRQGKRALRTLTEMPPLTDISAVTARFAEIRAEAEKMRRQRDHVIDLLSIALGNHGSIARMTRAEVGALVMALVNA